MLLNLVNYKTISQSFISFLCGFTADVLSCLPFMCCLCCIYFSVIYICRGKHLNKAKREVNLTCFSDKKTFKTDCLLVTQHKIYQLPFSGSSFSKLSFFFPFICSVSYINWIYLRFSLLFVIFKTIWRLSTLWWKYLMAITMLNRVP